MTSWEKWKFSFFPPFLLFLEYSPIHVPSYSDLRRNVRKTSNASEASKIEFYWKLGIKNIRKSRTRLDNHCHGEKGWLWLSLSSSILKIQSNLCRHSRTSKTRLKLDKISLNDFCLNSQRFLGNNWDDDECEKKKDRTNRHEIIV